MKSPQDPISIKNDTDMDELIIRSLQGRTSQAEEERLWAWRRQSPENERCYQELRELWSLTNAAAPGEHGDLRDVEVLVARADTVNDEERSDVKPIATDRSGEPSKVKTARSGSPWFRRAALGALAAGLVAVGFGIGIVPDGEDDRTLLSETEIITGAGEMTTVTLGDGSSIRVGPESRLRLSEEEGRRMAWLDDGRAFFGVQADSSRPFSVRTRYGEANALGTRFEVRSDVEYEDFRVLVLEGEVSVVADGSEVRLSENEMSRSTNGSSPSTEQVQDVHAHLDWIGNAIVFQVTPLERALREIERRYGVEVSLVDSSLADLTITATFTGRPVEEVLFVVCEIVNSTCTVDGDRIRIGATESEDALSNDAP